MELCLIFGTSSSVGIYDRVAKVVLAIALLVARFPEDLVCQHLDDVCAAGPADTGALEGFERAYKGVAAQVGVRLAPTTDWWAGGLVGPGALGKEDKLWGEG